MSSYLLIRKNREDEETSRVRGDSCSLLMQEISESPKDGDTVYVYEIIYDSLGRIVLLDMLSTVPLSAKSDLEGDD